jgi:hypothetical protein
MPFVGLGLHVLVALFFAVHAVRNGRELYWLIILFSFPLLGSIVYFLMVYLPSSRLDHGVRKTASAVATVLDPGRELREAQRAFDLTPTAQNQMRLAAALLEAGQTERAIEAYESCLKGPFAIDPEIRFGAARARLQHGEPTAAINLLEAIQTSHPDHRAEQVAILLGRSYAAAGRQVEAGQQLAQATARFGSMDARVEYAIWAAGSGDRALARKLKEEIEHYTSHWTKQTRTLNRELLRRLDEAYAKAGI